MQAMQKNAGALQARSSRLSIEALNIATQNRMIAKARWEAKKQKIRHGIPLLQEPFPSLIEHPKFYELLGNTTELTENRGLPMLGLVAHHRSVLQ